VGYADEPQRALRNAMLAINHGISESRKRAPKGLQEIHNSVSEMVPKEELFRTTNLFESNLVAMSSRPFTVWFIERSFLMEMLAGKMVVLAAFDLAGFIWLGQSIGLSVELTSRKDATQLAQTLGSANVPVWANRALCYVFSQGKSVTVLSGMLSRFFNDLTNPLSLMVHDRDHAAGFTQG
jgi:hypothetical protein